jgi:hypothetical protein
LWKISMYSKIASASSTPNQLTAADFIAHQLPDPCEGIIKPPTW